jgi:TetR/AcrR family transcriptional regulator, tetracycline repressor protein
MPSRTKPSRASTKKAASAQADPSAANLSRDLILATTLELIDQNGVTGFSVRDLARTLGVFPTAVYWYVESRNALIAGAVSCVMNDVTPPDPAGDWHEQLRGLFRRYRTAVRRHPNVAAVLGTQLISNESPNPNFIDAILALLEAAGFKDNQLVHAYNVVIAAMVGFVTMELASRPADDPQGWAEAHESHMQSVSPQKHPTLARNLPKLMKSAFIVRSSNGMEHPLDESFEAWVMVCLQGLTAMLHAVPATSKNKNVRQRR